MIDPATRVAAPTRPPAADGFVGDISFALRCWAADTRLPVLSLGLVVVGLVPSLLSAVLPPAGVLGVLLLPVAIFGIGFNGTQRVWYLRISRGLPISGAEVWSMSWTFLGRYLVLGLMTFWPVALLTLAWGAILVAQMTSHYVPGQPVPKPDLAFSPMLALVILASLLWDFALTFATPALAFSTSSASEALRIGWRMIRESWPAAALYVFFPPLALQVLSGIPGAAGVKALPILYCLSIVVSIFNLAAKGAVVAFYLRRVDVGDDAALESGARDWRLTPRPPGSVSA